MLHGQALFFHPPTGTKNVRHLYALLFLLLAAGCSSSTSQPAEADLDTEIAQMIMVGFREFAISDTNPVAAHLRNGRIGGVILFDYDSERKIYSRNIQSPQQLAQLCRQIQELAPRDVFIAIDQEGGRVNRLKQGYGFPATVSQAYLGRIDNDDTTAHYASQTAELLLSLGVNVNFGPVVDLNTNPDNPVIGKIERSFSSSASVVARHAGIVLGEYRRRNITGCLKHFPGHGSSAADSHLGFVDVSQSWTSTELQPYSALISAGSAEMVMTAHIFNSAWDAEYPATLSHSVITGMLRNQLGFGGVVITDDMQMAAIRDHYGLEQAVVRAVNAGVDILLFANNLVYDPLIVEKVSDILRRNVANGTIPRERISQAYNRIIALKKKYSLSV